MLKLNLDGLPPYDKLNLKLTGLKVVEQGIHQEIQRTNGEL